MDPRELFNINSLTRLARRHARSFGIRVLFAVGAAFIIGAGNIVYFSLREGWFGQTSLALAGACLIPAAAFIGLALDTRRRRRDRQIYKALTGWTTALLLPGLCLSTWLIYPGQWPAWASLALTTAAVIYLGLLFAGLARRSGHHPEYPSDGPPAEYPDYDELEEYPLEENDDRW
jgi:hypothetical protein